MFAYVKYIQDGCKEIVPIADIKDFDQKTGDLSKTYWVRWQDKYFKGQILLLKKSREEVEEVLAQGKRVRVKLIKDSSPPRPRSEEEEAKIINTNQKKAAEEAKRKNLLALLKERQNKRKLSPLCPTPNKKTKADNLSDKLGDDKVDDDDDDNDNGDNDDDDDDDGGVVPEKLFQEARQKQLIYKKQVNKMSLQLQETKQKLEKHVKRCAEVEAENKQLRSLNMQLQQQLLNSLNSSSDSRPPKPKETINVQNLQQPKPKSTLQIAEADCEKPSLPRNEDGIQMVELGDTKIRSDTWTAIQKNTRDSLFVKELAVAFWGTKTLGERSLTGKECPTTKTTKRPLTPQKLHTLKACFKEWLIKGNVEEPELQARFVKAGRYITEKIMDIKKQQKK